MRRRSLTLLEVIIAFALMGFLMAALIPLYFQTQKSQTQFEQGKEIVLQRLRFYFRMKYLFENSVVAVDKTTGRFVFSCTNDSDASLPLGEKLTYTLYQLGNKVVLDRTTESGAFQKEILWEKVEKDLEPRPQPSNAAPGNILHLSIDDTHFWFRKVDKA